MQGTVLAGLGPSVDFGVLARYEWTFDSDLEPVCTSQALQPAVAPSSALGLGEAANSQRPRRGAAVGDPGTEFCRSGGIEQRPFHSSLLIPPADVPYRVWHCTFGCGKQICLDAHLAGMGLGEDRGLDFGSEMKWDGSASAQQRLGQHAGLAWPEPRQRSEPSQRCRRLRFWHP